MMKKAGTKSPHQARQVVVHGHVSIGDRIVNLPGYIVKKEEENLITLRMNMLPGSSSTPRE